MYTHTHTCSPVAVAIYDYDALAEPGEDDNLEFDEGDLIEVSISCSISHLFVSLSTLVFIR